MPNRSFRLSSALEYAHFIVICQCPMAPMGYPGYVRNRSCASPSPLPFYYVMAKNVPAMHLATHAKCSTLYGRSNGRRVVSPNFFGLMGYNYFV